MGALLISTASPWEFHWSLGGSRIPIDRIFPFHFSNLFLSVGAFSQSFVLRDAFDRYVDCERFGVIWLLIASHRLVNNGAKLSRIDGVHDRPSAVSRFFPCLFLSLICFGGVGQEELHSQWLLLLPLLLRRRPPEWPGRAERVGAIVRRKCSWLLR